MFSIYLVLLLYQFAGGLLRTKRQPQGGLRPWNWEARRLRSRRASVSRAGSEAVSESLAQAAPTASGNLGIPWLLSALAWSLPSPARRPLPLGISICVQLVPSYKDTVMLDKDFCFNLAVSVKTGSPTRGHTLGILGVRNINFQGHNSTRVCHLQPQDMK